jgi:hypothetical protein
MRDQRPCSIAVRISRDLIFNLCHSSGFERCTDFFKKNVEVGCPLANAGDILPGTEVAFTVSYKSFDK